MAYSNTHICHPIKDVLLKASQIYRWSHSPIHTHNIQNVLLFAIIRMEEHLFLMLPSFEQYLRRIQCQPTCYSWFNAHFNLVLLGTKWRCLVGIQTTLFTAWLLQIPLSAIPAYNTYLYVYETCITSRLAVRECKQGWWWWSNECGQALTAVSTPRISKSISLDTIALATHSELKRIGHCQGLSGGTI